MEKFDKMIRWFVLGVLLCALGNIAMLDAETGWENATRKSIGETITVASVDVDSFTGTALFSASFKRPDGSVFNNSAFTIWVGTVTGTYSAPYQHPNITTGFPVLASSTFRLDGSYTGVLYGTSDATRGTINVRTISGTVQ